MLKNEETMLKSLLVDVTGILGEIPDWATHVALSCDGKRAELAAWLEEAKEYLDEDPSQLKHGQWGGSYKKRYWTFVPIEKVKADLAAETEAKGKTAKLKQLKAESARLEAWAEAGATCTNPTRDKALAKARAKLAKAYAEAEAQITALKEQDDGEVQNNQAH